MCIFSLLEFSAIYARLRIAFEAEATNVAFISTRIRSSLQRCPFLAGSGSGHLLVTLPEVPMSLLHS